MTRADHPEWDLHEAVALWGARLAPASAVVDAAAAALVAALAEGRDGPALRELAAAGRSEADRRFPGVLDAACAELGLLRPWRGSRRADEEGVRALARQVMRGRLAPRRFTALLHARFGYVLDLTEELVAIHHDYGTAPGGPSEARLDAEVLAEAWWLGADPALGPRRRPVTTARELVLGYVAELTVILAELGRNDPPAGCLTEWLVLARTRRIPRLGVVGGRLYLVHGAGCRFTGPDGVEVEVDTTGPGTVTFDAWRLQCYGAGLPEAFAAEQHELRAAAGALPQLTGGGRPGWFVLPG
ncbi:DUF6896 domain-containing protein [Kitasatospora sp. NPDC101157]|uniref:DUF6896 domain-containing protein n=1 Tax=Kitasatospora sp. NPDC101157 TaxID=3364098 RepID=UPI003807063D